MMATPEQVEDLAKTVHEADWMMAGPRWPWHQSTTGQRADARNIALAALATTARDETTLEALVREHWTGAPRHGAPRRVEAKVAKIRAWLTEHDTHTSQD